MLGPPIRVSLFGNVPDLVPLDPMSRINLAKLYTVEHNVKVKPYGMVEDIQHLVDCWMKVILGTGSRSRTQQGADGILEAFPIDNVAHSSGVAGVSITSNIPPDLQQRLEQRRTLTEAARAQARRQQQQQQQQ